MPPQKLYEYEQYDFENPQFGMEEIHKINPQRFEMEQLSGVVHVDTVGQGAVGFKDVTEDEFWVRGHMPGFPLMPGVILCEAAAQLAGFYARKFNLLECDFVGFGGMNTVKFRAPVYPNNRLVLMIQLTKLRPRRRAEFDLQGFVDGTMTFSGNMVGVPITQGDRAPGLEA